VTLYWRMSRIVERLIPHKWMRVWAIHHVESLNLRIVEPVLDMTIVAHKDVTITISGEQLLLRPGDIVNLETMHRPAPRMNSEVLH
jgi:hypothetical protein